MLEALQKQKNNQNQRKKCATGLKGKREKTMKIENEEKR